MLHERATESRENLCRTLVQGVVLWMQQHRLSVSEDALMASITAGEPWPSELLLLGQLPSVLPLQPGDDAHRRDAWRAFTIDQIGRLLMCLQAWYAEQRTLATDTETLLTELAACAREVAGAQRQSAATLSEIRQQLQFRSLGAGNMNSMATTITQLQRELDDNAREHEMEMNLCRQRQADFQKAWQRAARNRETFVEPTQQQPSWTSVLGDARHLIQGAATTTLQQAYWWFVDFRASCRQPPPKATQMPKEPQRRPDAAPPLPKRQRVDANDPNLRCTDQRLAHLMEFIGVDVTNLPAAKLLALFGTNSLDDTIAVCKNMLLVLHPDKQKTLSNFTNTQRTELIECVRQFLQHARSLRS